ncbi:MAG: glycosyltransferase [Candidatus Thermoplasmatota archaeon]|nr:glycosyltransferase [Candidatus Thermoplasmatota archaeon]MCL5730574.1 glycosyltransferase [Candidatus Thermoplasmatota archaeon]
MQTNNPLISIIIPAHDRRAFVTNAVRSVLDQDCQREIYEVIVVKNFIDDFIDRFLNEHGIQTVFTEEKPLSKKIIAGLKVARGSVICFLDDDDEFVKHKISEVDKLFRDGNVIFYHNGYYPIDSGGKKIRTRERMRGTKAESGTPEEFAARISEFLTLRADWYMSMISMRREVLEKYIPELNEITASIDKFLFYISANETGKVIADSRELTRYRIHSSLTNFTEPLASFSSKKSDFYRRSSETFRKLAELSKNRSVRKVIECVGRHEKVLADFHVPRGIKRKERIVDAIQLLRCNRAVRSRAFYFWALAGLLGAFQPRIPLFFYHLIYDRELRRIFAGGESGDD